MNVLTYFNIFIKVVCFYLIYLYKSLQTNIFGVGVKTGALSGHNAPAGLPARYGYLTHPLSPPPHKYFCLQPFVQVNKIKMQNFYETIKVS